MALLSAPTSDQLTDLRSDNHYRALQFVCLVPNTVIARFQPSAAPSTDVYAQISVGTVSTGSMSNVRAGMTVIYSTTTDHAATETFRTRVRKVSGTSILYVAENSQGLTTSDYVTVINTYEITERLRHDETSMDWEISFRKLLPIERALPTAKVLTNGTTSWSPTASPKAMDASATTSFTHAWESSNGSDSISNANTASPTFTFQAAAFRWLRYTFTDSNGNPNYRVIAVWTVPKNYSSVVSLGFVGNDGGVADISFDAELGWTATVPAWDGISTLLNKTFCVIANDEWIDDTRQNIRTNINMCGWLQTESTTTQGSETAGKSSETRFTIEGIGHQLSRQNIAPLRITRVTGTPTAWGEIQNPTPARMLTMVLTEESTALNLCSLSIPSDDTDFVGDDLTVSSTKAMEAVNFIGEVINAELQFDVDGHLDFCRNLNFLDDTARDAAPVIVTLEASDLLSLTYDEDHSKTTSMVTLKGGSFNTTTGEYDLFEAIAPAVARESEGDPMEVSNQVLTTDNTAAESIAEAQERASNIFAANNPTTTARFSPKPEFHWLIPDIGSWIKFSIASTDTVRGRVYSSSDRWQVISYSLSTNSETGTRELDLTARHETQSTGAMTRAAPIVVTDEVEQVFFPATTLPFSGMPTGDGLFYDSLDTQPPGNQNPPEDPNCELGGFRVRDGLGYETTRPALNGEEVSILVRGAGKIGASVTYLDQMSLNLGAKSHEVSVSYPVAIYNGTSATRNGTSAGSWIGTEGNGGGGSIQGSLVNASGNSLAGIVIDLGALYTVSAVSFDYKYAPNSPGSALTFVTFYGTSLLPADRTETTLTASGGADTYHTNTWTGTQSGVRYIVVQNLCNRTPATTAYLDNISVTYGGLGDDTYGDFCYQWTGALDNPVDPIPYDSGEGGLIELAQPSSIPPFNPTHEYSFFETVTSGPVRIDFESPYSLAEATNWSVQSIVCFNGVP